VPQDPIRRDPAVAPLPRAPTPRLLDQVPVFRYVTAENAPNYRAILEVFVEAKEHYVIELRPADSGLRQRAPQRVREGEAADVARPADRRRRTRHDKSR